MAQKVPPFVGQSRWSPGLSPFPAVWAGRDVPAPLAPASRMQPVEVTSTAQFTGTWKLPTPKTFRNEEGPHLLTLGGGWGELPGAKGGRGPGGGEWVGRLGVGDGEGRAVHLRGFEADHLSTE